MKNIKVTIENKAYITRRYVDYIVSHMDEIDMLDSVKDYIYREKFNYPNATLETEIARHCPELLQDHTTEELVGKGGEYAKAI
ncbi:hypothetical protein EBZ38_07935 [bacterium]|nr:hypothetical protein [bacterium]